jgi:SAM-dependent methyltransferase
LLDFGCGRGLRLLAFRELGFDVHGVDFQPEAVDYVSRQLHLPATCCDVDQLDDVFTPESFDIVTAFYVVEHVLDVQQLVSKCAGLLKPGGCFVAAVPFCDSGQAGLLRSKWSQVTEAPRHVSLPSCRAMELVARRVGLGQIRIAPDSLRNSAGALSLSLVPGSATDSSYGAPGVVSVLRRLAGSLIAAAAVPWCLFENVFLNKPAMGVVFAWKPPGTVKQGNGATNAGLV